MDETEDEVESFQVPINNNRNTNINNQTNENNSGGAHLNQRATSSAEQTSESPSDEVSSTGGGQPTVSSIVALAGLSPQRLELPLRPIISSASSQPVETDEMETFQIPSQLNQSTQEESKINVNNTSKQEEDERKMHRKHKKSLHATTSKQSLTTNTKDGMVRIKSELKSEEDVTSCKKNEPLDVVVEENAKTAVPPPTRNEPDKCPVCLQAFASAYSKSYTSRCFHAFCFECILEWSKVRYQCPLCKTDFDRILYNVVSRLEYKEYALKPREPAHPTLDIIPIYPEDEATRSLPPPRSKASWVVKHQTAPDQFRMLIYAQSWHVSKYQTQLYVRTTNIELEGGSESPLPRHQQHQHTQANVTSDNLECVAYQPVHEFRDVSPEFYTNNPAMLHRVMYFLRREIRALAGILPPNRSVSRLNHALREELANLILSTIKTTPLESKQFLTQISSYIRPLRYARHFQHELLAFAMSKLTSLEDYDARCVYYKSREEIPRNTSNNEPIIPMRSLPVILTKYKYTSYPDDYMNSFHHSLRFFTEQASLEAAARAAALASFGFFSRSNQNNDNHNHDHQYHRSTNHNRHVGESGSGSNNLAGGEEEAEVISDQSSFCEELTPPRKKTPEIIDLISSSDESSIRSIHSDVESRPEEKKKSKRRRARTRTPSDENNHSRSPVKSRKRDMSESSKNSAAAPCSSKRRLSSSSLSSEVSTNAKFHESYSQRHRDRHERDKRSRTSSSSSRKKKKKKKKKKNRTLSPSSEHVKRRHKSSYNSHKSTTASPSLSRRNVHD